MNATVRLALSYTMMSRVLVSLLLVLSLGANIASAGIASYDHVWKLFSWSPNQMHRAMEDTALEKRLDDGLVLLKDMRRQLQSGLPNEDVRTNVALNLEGI